jgi:hypothetical protein
VETGPTGGDVTTASSCQAVVAGDERQNGSPHQTILIRTFFRQKMGARKQQRGGAARKQPVQQQQQGQLKKGAQLRKKQALSQKVREKKEQAAVLAARRRKMTVDLMKIEIVTEPDIPEVKRYPTFFLHFIALYLLLYAIRPVFHVVGCGPVQGYSEFHNLMGFISKKMPNNIFFKMFVKNFSVS